jgi:hypothetical protein
VKNDIFYMTKEEKLARWKEAFAAEEFFPGVLGNPVTFAVKWGLPLSKSYLKHLDSRKEPVKKAHRSQKAKS